MRTVVFSLVERSTGDTKVISVPNRCNCELHIIQRRVLKENPGWFVRKATVK